MCSSLDGSHRRASTSTAALAAATDGADELPIPGDLPVLPARRVTQVHCLAYRAWRPTKSMNLVATTCRFRHRGADGGERCERRDRVAAPFDYLNCGSWASLDFHGAGKD